MSDAAGATARRRQKVKILTGKQFWDIRNIPGPNDFVNEDQEEAKTEHDWKNGETPAGEGKKGWLIWVQMACLILATLGLFAKLYSKCKSCCQCCIDWRCAGGDEEQQLNSDTIICYLCNKKSKNSCLYTVFENHPKCRSWIFKFGHFPPSFVLLKLTCLTASFRFSKTRQIEHFWHF